MDALHDLLMGFSVALAPGNLLYAFLGSAFGTLIGVLPGIGPAAGTALLIPLTARLDPTGAIIMLTAIFYGTQYGGTITMARLLPVQTARSLLERIQTALTTRQMQTMEFQLDDGSTSTYYEARLIISGEEEVTAIIRNVSERARLEQMKSDFINRATHELRTPITTSLLMINLLESASSPAEISQYTAILKNEIERQRLLVEDLLTVAKLDNNAYEMSDRPVQPEIILAGVIASEKVVADSRQVQLEARVQGPLPLVMGDERALQQVFTNLIDNAVKFTPPGGKVQIEAQTEGAQLLIKVQDTGIGIPPEDIPNLFTRFFRASNARSREVPGTGIGLYIVKSIVEKMGGQISVASQLEQGTTFSIRLPHLGGSRQEN